MNPLSRIKTGFAVILVVALGAFMSPLGAQVGREGGIAITGFGGFTTDPGGFDVFRDTEFDAAYHVGASLTFRLTPNVAVRGDVSKAWSSGRETTVLQGELVDFNRIYYGGALEVRFPLSAVTPYLLAGGGMVTVDRTAPSRNYTFTELAGRFGAGLAYPVSGTSLEAFVEGSQWFYGRTSTGEGTQFDTSLSVGLTFVPGL